MKRRVRALARKLGHFLDRATGGRPMRRVGYAFTDAVSGRGVHYYVCRDGTLWLAEHRWSLFRERASRNNIG